MNANVALEPSLEMEVIRLCGRTVIISVHLLLSLRFGRDSRFVLIKILVPSLQTLVQAWHIVIVQALLFVPYAVASEAILTLSGGVLCGTGFVSNL